MRADSCKQPPFKASELAYACAKSSRMSNWRSYSVFISSHAGISFGRSVRFVSSGVTPSSFCRAKDSSRSLPRVNSPLYVSIHSFRA